MRLRNRFLLSLLALSALMTLPALYAAGEVREIRDIALNLREDAARTALTVGRLRGQLSDLNRLQRGYVATGSPSLGRALDRTMRGIEAQVDSLRAFGHGDIVRDAALPVDALRVLTDSVTAMVGSGAMAAATDHLGTVNQPLFSQADAAIAQLSAAIDSGTAARTERAEAIASAASRGSIIAILLALLATVAVAWLTARVLTRPIERLRAGMGKVAQGQFENGDDPAVDRPDEIGDLYRSFHAMTARLAELDRMKAEFVGIASHDLKTPINVITGYAEMMEEELSPTLQDRHRELLRSLSDQTRSLAERVDQLIEISRMESGGLRLGLEEINVRHFANGVQKEFAAAARTFGVHLDVEVDSAAPTFLVADPDCVRTEILGNLLGNAFKFSPRGARVDLSFRGGGGSLIIQVRDQGPGIPPDEVPHLFDRYFQGSSSSGRVGSGLGLPIARAGVLAHGGTIGVSSEEGRGATFIVQMPLRPAAQATEQLVPHNSG